MNDDNWAADEMDIECGSSPFDADPWDDRELDVGLERVAKALRAALERKSVRVLPYGTSADREDLVHDAMAIWLEKGGDPTIVDVPQPLRLIGDAQGQRPSEEQSREQYELLYLAKGRGPRREQRRKEMVIMAGQLWKPGRVGPAADDVLFESWAIDRGLAPREREILFLRVEGWSIRAIAEKLGRTKSAVLAGLDSIDRKFKRRTQAWWSAGWITPGGGAGPGVIVTMLSLLGLVLLWTSMPRAPARRHTEMTMRPVVIPTPDPDRRGGRARVRPEQPAPAPLEAFIATVRVDPRTADAEPPVEVESARKPRDGAGRRRRPSDGAPTRVPPREGPAVDGSELQPGASRTPRTARSDDSARWIVLAKKRAQAGQYDRALMLLDVHRSRVPPGPRAAVREKLRIDILCVAGRYQEAAAARTAFVEEIGEPRERLGCTHDEK